VARDAERRRTYDAENRAFQGTLAEAALTFAEVSDLAQSLMSTPWWRSRAQPVRLVRGRGIAVHSHYSHDLGRITLSEAQQTPATLAHELAHAVSDDGHGPRFRAALCALITGLCGKKPATTLLNEFSTGGLATASIDIAGLPDPPLLARHPRFGGTPLR
jgi:hypothetical protein